MTDMQESEDVYARVISPEDWLFAALLDMVIDHCVTPGDKLDSFGWQSNAAAMRLLAGAGFIEIESEADQRITAHIMPAAHELKARVIKA